MIELNKVKTLALSGLCACDTEVRSQKFRTYLLEQEKSMDIVCYLLCYFLEIRDKPRRSSEAKRDDRLLILSRAAWPMQSLVVHHPNTIRGTCFWSQALVPYKTCPSTR